MSHEIVLGDARSVACYLFTQFLLMGLTGAVVGAAASYQWGPSLTALLTPRGLTSIGVNVNVGVDPGYVPYAVIVAIMFMALAFTVVYAYY
jgi:hypothetical protein